jgi:sirohydrochlorin ferrochelatase
MNGLALVLAAHGSTEPAVNEGILELARRAGRRLGKDEAIAAFHRGEPTFSNVLDGLRASAVVVVPLLQAEGYYCQKVLPAELAKNRRFGAVRLHQTRAVGVHPALDAVLERRVAELLVEHRLDRPAIALVAHGTPRHRGSREAAAASAAELARRTGLSTRAFFLDEDPPIDSIRDLAPGRDLIVVPLLIGAGRHATGDLVRRLGGATPAPPRAGGRMVVDRPLGLDPAIEEIVVDLARGGDRLDAAVSGSPGTTT